MTATPNARDTYIGRPYKVKTKLPFYDDRGAFKGVKLSKAML